VRSSANKETNWNVYLDEKDVALNERMAFHASSTIYISLVVA